MTGEKINYIELPARDIEGSKRFFSDAFDWRFIEYGPDYAAFEDAGIDGGFFSSDLTARTDSGSALVVMYSDDLEATQARVEDAGGTILKAIFSFPGGRRFHFSDPSDNEYAVWSEN